MTVRVLLTGLLWLAAIAPLAAENWPQWRGPNGGAISNETGFVDDWSPQRNILWKTPIPGRGHSSPIVWEDRIFLTAAVRGKANATGGVTHYRDGQVYRHPQSVGAEFNYRFLALCLDLKTGRVLWRRTVHEGAPYDNRHLKNTYASSTPVTDGQRVYFYFESEGVYAYDFDGWLAWSSEIGKIPKAGMGPGTSPVLYRDLLILQADKQGFRVTTDPAVEVPEDRFGEDSFLVALDKSTGKQVWRTPRNHRRSWATPLLLLGGNRPQLIASGAESVIAYDPATGSKLWSAPGVVSHPIPSPVQGEGLVFASAGSREKKALAIRTGLDLSEGERVAWSYGKGTAYVPSPIYYRGYLYLLTDKGIVTCIEAATGRVVYEGGRVPVPATFKASPVAFEGKILLTSEDGDTFVLKAGPRHDILRVNSVGEPVWASPVLSRGMILIRGEKHLFAIGKSPGQVAP